MALATTPTGNFPAFSQLAASHPDAAQMPSAINPAIAIPTNSTLLSKSRIDWAVCAPPVNLAISRPSAGFIPISSNDSQANSKVKIPISPLRLDPKVLDVQRDKGHAHQRSPALTETICDDIIL